MDTCGVDKDVRLGVFRNPNTFIHNVDKISTSEKAGNSEKALSKDMIMKIKDSNQIKPIYFCTCIVF